jgi:tetratricopeptide (TPR) repeat protein
VALRWLDRILDRFHDGQLYAKLAVAAGEPVAVEDILGEFLRSLGVGSDQMPASLAGRAALFRSVTVGLSVVVLLDDAVSAAQVRPLLPASALSMVAVTSRRPLAGLLAEGAVTVSVDPLDADSSLDLLRRHLGAQRVESEARPAEALVSLCAGLPIALCVVAAHLTLRPRRPMTKLVDELRDEARRLDALSLEDMSVRATLDLSYRALSTDAASAYVAIGVHPGTLVSTKLVAVMLRRGSRDAQRALDRLADASLVQEVDDELYRYHDLVGAHARSAAEATLDHDEWTAMARRALEWHLHVAGTAAITIMPSRPRSHLKFPVYPSSDLPAEVHQYPGALAWLERHRWDLAASMRLAADNGFSDLVYALGEAMQPLFIVRNHVREAAEVDELALNAALAMDDYRAELNMRKRLARLLIQLDELPAAQRHIDSLLARSDERGDRRGRASGLKTLARLHSYQGRHSLAVEAFTKTVQILRALGRTRSQGLALTELGTALIDLGSPERAVIELEQARRILSELDTPDPYNAARASVGLARARLKLADHTAALRLLEDARTVLESLGADQELSRAHAALADVHAAVGDDNLAREHRNRADEILASLVDPAPDRLF